MFYRFQWISGLARGSGHVPCMICTCRTMFDQVGVRFGIGFGIG